MNANDYSSHMSGHKKFSCSKCGMRFYQNETLLEHEKTHLKCVKTLNCETCGKIFLKAESLEKHQECHNLSPKKEICEICNEIFDDIKSLKQHIMNNHGDPNVICELCGKEYRPDRIKKHIEAMHSSKKTHQCPLCYKYFLEVIQYNKHLQEHSEENFKGKFDKNTMETKTIKQYSQETISELQQILEGDEPMDVPLINTDMEIETTEHMEKENITKAMEADNQVLVEEIQMNNGKRNSTKDIPFKRKKMFNFAVNAPNAPSICRYCLKSFNNVSSLQLHTLTHFRSQKQEKCSHCNLTFPSKMSRLRHERSHATVSYKFRCVICWRIMKNQEELDSHLTTHKNVLTCEKCGEKFGHQWQFDRHNALYHEKSDTDQRKFSEEDD